MGAHGVTECFRSYLKTEQVFSSLLIWDICVIDIYDIYDNISTYNDLFTTNLNLQRKVLWTA